MELYSLTVGMLATNCYVLVNKEKNEAIVVDPGGSPRSILEFLQSIEPVKVVAIFLTHSHSDHISALNDVRKATGAEVYISREDAPDLLDANGNLSFFVGTSVECEAADKYFEDGTDVEVAGFTFKVLATPGHTKGGVCLYDAADDIAFTGDTIFCESIGRTDLPGGSYRQIIKSIKEKIMILPDKVCLLPGHGPKTSVGWERKRNPFLQ